MQRRIRALEHISHWYEKAPNALCAAQDEAPTSVHNMKAGDLKMFAI